MQSVHLLQAEQLLSELAAFSSNFTAGSLGDSKQFPEGTIDAEADSSPQPPKQRRNDGDGAEKVRKRLREG